jgi:hypothetical protein
MPTMAYDPEPIHQIPEDGMPCLRLKKSLSAQRCIQQYMYNYGTQKGQKRQLPREELFIMVFQIARQHYMPNSHMAATSCWRTDNCTRTTRLHR